MPHPITREQPPPAPEPGKSDDRPLARPGSRLRIRTLLPVLVLAGLVLAHLEVQARGPSYAGPLLVLDHLFDLVVAGLALTLFTGTGRRALRRTRLEPDHPLDALLWGAAVGAGLWGLGLLALGIVGLLAPPAVLLAALPVAFLVRSEVAELPDLARAGARDLVDSVRSALLLGLAGVVAAPVAGFLLLHGSAPPGDWDSLMYHLEIPARWLEAGVIHLPPGNLHAAYTSLHQILYVPLLAVGSTAGPALLNGLFALLLGLAVFRVGSRLFEPETGIVSATVLWASTGLLFVAITPRVDTTLAFFLILAQGAVALALVEPSAGRSHLTRAAVVLGFAVGIKYHALAFTAALAPVGLWALWRSTRKGPERNRLLLVLVALFLAGSAPWMLKNVVLVGQPFYPFFGDRILQPWLAELYGTRTVPPELEAAVFGALAEAREPFDLVSLFLSPERLTVEPEGVHYHTSFLFLLLPLWLLHARSRRVAALAAPALLYAVGVALVVSTINLRYLFPAIPALTVVTAFFAVSLFRRLPQTRLRRGALAVLVVLCLIPSVRSAYAWTRQSPVLEQATGQLSRQEYLEAGFTYYAALAGVVNQAVPPEGTVLLLWEARGFYLAPDHLPDNVLTNWPLLREHTAREGGCLEGTGITHVLAATAAARYYESRGSDPERFDLEGFRAFADRCLEPVRLGPAFGLYGVADIARSGADGPA